jgi:hypothetical protein
VSTCMNLEKRGSRDTTFDDFLGAAGLMSMTENLFGFEDAAHLADWMEEPELSDWLDSGTSLEYEGDELSRRGGVLLQVG